MKKNDFLILEEKFEKEDFNEEAGFLLEEDQL